MAKIIIIARAITIVELITLGFSCLTTVLGKFLTGPYSNFSFCLLFFKF